MLYRYKDNWEGYFKINNPPSWLILMVLRFWQTFVYICLRLGWTNYSATHHSVTSIPTLAICSLLVLCKIISTFSVSHVQGACASWIYIHRLVFSVFCISVWSQFFHHNGLLGPSRARILPQLYVLLARSRASIVATDISAQRLNIFHAPPTVDECVPCQCRLSTQRWIVAYLNVELKERTILSDFGLSVA